MARLIETNRSSDRSRAPGRTGADHAPPTYGAAGRSSASTDDGAAIGQFLPPKSEQHIAPRLDDFVSIPGYEEVCREWPWERTGAASVGIWWGNLRVQTEEGPRSIQYEADAVAVDGKGRVLALGSCKWTNEVQRDDERKKLEKIAAEISTDGQDEPDLYFFAREGFSDGLHARAASDPDRIHLVSVEDMYP